MVNLYLDVITTYYHLDMLFTGFSVFCLCSLRSDIASFKTGAIAGQVLGEGKRPLESCQKSHWLVLLRLLTGSGFGCVAWSSLDSLKYWYFRCLLSELHLNSLISVPICSYQKAFEKRSRMGIYFLGIVMGKRKPVFKNLIL